MQDSNSSFSNRLNWIMFAIIAVLILIIGGMNAFHHDPKPEIIVKRTLDTTWVHDTVTKVVKHPVPYKVVESKVTDTVLTDDCDCLRDQCKILNEDYRRQRFYADTAKFDSTYVTYDIAISKNKVDSVKTQFHLTYPTIHEKETITKTEHDGRQLYLGASVGGINKLQGFMIGGSVLYKNRKDNITAVTVSIDNTGNYYYQLSRYFKISFKRK